MTQEDDMQRVRASLGRILPPETTDRWLTTPNQGFGGLTPLSLIENGETDRILSALDELGSGEPS
jgi:hypothetical protein